MPDLRVIPSIEQLRQRPGVEALERRHGSHATVAALRAEAHMLRQSLLAGQEAPASSSDAAAHIERGATDRLRGQFQGSLRRIVNATGVVVHTNLGRAPLADAAIDRAAAIAAGYSNLEYDLQSGTRGSRHVHAENLLTALTGAEAAIVVNNNAAATLLVLAGLASGREVVVSRGELVEIGGGFRVPDVMAQSGAVLREVGTTNRTRISDYTASVSEATALVLRVHQSNFRIEGFAERPTLADLVTAARQLNVPLVEDLGSGSLVEGLAGEPTAQASIDAGVDIVCFSADKLLGGPQAGLIVGRRALVDVLRRHPLMRALRVDKLTLAALEGTLLEYLAGRADSVPVVRMIRLAAEAIETRARALAGRLVEAGWRVELRSGASAVGGGSAPGVEIPTVLLAIERDGLGADALEARLRCLDPPIVARIEHDRVVLDLRTVAEPEEDALVKGLATIAGGTRA
jgi:L-seryl-tRNA(Ser) seleniumtransferase